MVELIGRVEPPAVGAALAPVADDAVGPAIEEVPYERAPVLEDGQRVEGEPADVVVASARRRARGEPEPASPERLRGFAGAEARVTVIAVEVEAVRRGVVEDTVEDETDSLCLGSGRQRGERRVSPERRVDVHVVGRVVAMVRSGVEDRREPDRLDAERLQVVELVLDPLEIPAEEVAIEDARALWVLDRLVPGLMQDGRSASVERRTPGRAAAATVVVARVPVPKAVGEDRVHDRALEPGRRREAGVVDGQLEPLCVDRALYAGSALVDVVVRRPEVVAVPEHTFSHAGSEDVTQDGRLGGRPQSDAPETPETVQ